MLGNLRQPAVCWEIKANRLFPGKFKPAGCFLENLSQPAVHWEF
jgi:hypothetical protein